MSKRLSNSEENSSNYGISHRSENSLHLNLFNKKSIINSNRVNINESDNKSHRSIFESPRRFLGDTSDLQISYISNIDDKHPLNDK